jgi:sirohydrochlorin ferrochelatase
MAASKHRQGGISDPALQVLLVDNGSLAPAATRQLRKIATALGQRLKRKVKPVSVLHSDKVPAEKLGGRKAEILAEAVPHRLRAGARKFLIVPLFFGPSRALTEFIPESVGQWRKDFPEITVRVAKPLAARGDDQLARILETQVRAKLTPAFLRGQRARVALVDHGSPVKAVTQVRNRLAAQLRRRLGVSVAGVAACSMERRPGAAYAFNEPLLETLLARPPWNSGPVIVAQLFLLPGRHAGPGGDVEEICRRAREKSPGLRTMRTKLVGEDPALGAILADRFRATRQGGSFLVGAVDDPRATRR